MEVVTADLSKFQARELTEAVKLLNAYIDKPQDFLGDGLTLNFNTSSGNVFLCDDDYRVAMMNGDNLEEWFNCPYCGWEGFKEDMKHEPKDKDCTEYLEQIGVI